MPTEIDTEIRPEIVSLANELGKNIIFNIRAEGIFNTSTNKVTKGVLNSETVRALPPAAPKRELIDGTLIRHGDLFVAIPAQGLTFNPITANIETVLIDGELWKRQSVNPVYSGEQICMYKLHLRK